MATTTAAQPTTVVAGELAGRVAVVTGASSGIGAATARALAARGARVALLARRTGAIEALAAALPEGQALAVPADVTDPGALEDAAERVAAGLGRPDLVVANAGLMLGAPWTEQPLGDMQRMLDVNVAGVWATAAAFRPALLDGGGDLVVVSSIGARVPFPAYAAYCATKAAVSTWASIVRAELAGSGVRVTVVEPGFTTTELLDRDTGASRDAIAAVRDTLTTLTADDVAATIAFAVAQPPHVVVDHLEVRPSAQPL